MLIRVAVLIGVGFLFFGCGGGEPEVWIRINGDNTRPCLGATHLKMSIKPTSGESMDFHRFGIFFDSTTFLCKIEQQSFSDLPFGTDYLLSLTLFDSTTDSKGVLSQYQLNDPLIDVDGNSPIQEVTFSLNRLPGVEDGTMLLKKPADWETARSGGVSKLRFEVTKKGETIAKRKADIVWQTSLQPDPFPLSISNLPWPTAAEEYSVKLIGANSEGVDLSTWIGTASLQIGDVQQVDLSTGG